MNQNIDLNLNTTERLSQKPFGFWLIIVSALVVVTQLARYTVLHFNWSYFPNDRFAFSLDLPQLLMYAIYIFVLTGVIIFLYKQWQALSENKRFGFGLIIAGGISNIAERIYFGHVVDYFFILNGVLNIADFYIIIGALLIIIDRKSFRKV